MGPFRAVMGHLSPCSPTPPPAVGEFGVVCPGGSVTRKATINILGLRFAGCMVGPLQLKIDGSKNTTKEK